MCVCVVQRVLKYLSKRLQYVFTQLLLHEHNVIQDYLKVMFEVRVSPRLFVLQQSKRTQSIQLFTQSWKVINGFMPFPEGISTNWNANSLVEVLEHGSPITFSTTITIALSARVYCRSIYHHSHSCHLRPDINSYTSTSSFVCGKMTIFWREAATIIIYTNKNMSPRGASI